MVLFSSYISLLAMLFRCYVFVTKVLINHLGIDSTLLLCACHVSCRITTKHEAGN